MFSLDNLSLSDSSSSFLLYFRTAMEECNHRFEHIQHRKLHQRIQDPYLRQKSRWFFDPLMQIQYALVPLPRHKSSCPTHWPETQMSRGLSASKLKVHLPSTLKKSLTLEENFLPFQIIHLLSSVSRMKHQDLAKETVPRIRRPQTLEGLSMSWDIGDKLSLLSELSFFIFKIVFTSHIVQNVKYF